MWNFIQYISRTLTKRFSRRQRRCEAKTATDVTADLIKDLFEDRGLKSCCLNLDEIKNKIDAENKGPY